MQKQKSALARPRGRWNKTMNEIHGTLKETGLRDTILNHFDVYLAKTRWDGLVARSE
jgi:hypothetical protein